MRFPLLFVLATLAAAQTPPYPAVNEALLQQRLRLAQPLNAERYNRLKLMFSDSGCLNDAYREQPVKGVKEPNMLCDLAGTGDSPRTIIVGAHFDAEGGDGVVDNWSGAVLLPSLFELLHRQPRHHAFEFVAFTAEEKGLYGSRAYLKSLSKEQRQQIAAVITMDSLGLTPTKYWPHGSTKELIDAAYRIASGLHLDLQGVNVDGVATTDSQTFHDAHIPVLSLHSVTKETFGLINNRSDVWSIVSWKDYYDSQRLVAALLVYLDETLP